jgi:hypothetical protein
MAKKFAVAGYGSTGVVATGTAVAHGCHKTPDSVQIVAKAAGAADPNVTAVGAATFTVNFGGGNNIDFYFIALEP